MSVPTRTRPPGTQQVLGTPPSCTRPTGTSWEAEAEHAAGGSTEDVLPTLCPRAPGSPGSPASPTSPCPGVKHHQHLKQRPCPIPVPRQPQPPSTNLLPLLPGPPRWSCWPLVPSLPTAASDARSSAGSCFSLERMKTTRVILSRLLQLALALPITYHHAAPSSPPVFLAPGAKASRGPCFPLSHPGTSTLEP